MSSVATLKSLSANRSLIFQLLKADISSRYRGTFLGVFWSLVNPLVMLIMYFFLFAFIFQARWQTGQESKVEYALFIFGGIIIHSFFAEVLGRSPDLIVSRPNFVKKVVFPLEVLPVVTSLSALFHFIIGLGVFIAASVYYRGIPQATALPGLLVIIPYLLMLAGVSYYLSSLGVFLRDLGQITGQLSTAMLFLSPVLYPVEALPEPLRQLIMLNPITYPIEALRAVFSGSVADFYGMLLYSGVAIFIFLSGAWWFGKTRKGFADVI